MEEIIISQKKKVELLDKLIIFMMVIVAIIGLMINEIELKIISGALFIIGGLVLFFSIKGKKNHNNDVLINNSTNAANDASSIDKKFEDNTHHDDFVIVKSIPNHKKTKKNFYEKKNGEDDFKDNDKEENNLNITINFPKDEDNQEVVQETNTNTSFELKKNSLIIAEDPKSEFNIFLNNILSIIKETVFAHSVLFFWVDIDRKKIVLDSYISSSSNIGLSKKDTLEYGYNLISRVVSSKKAEIITNINPDSIQDLLCFYKGDEKIRSVIGLPIFFEDAVVAVLIIDSLEEDAFGLETVNQLNNFIQLLSSLINSSTEKYEYYNDYRILKKLNSLYENLYNGFDLNGFIIKVSQEIKDLIDWEFTAVILNDSGDWVIREIEKKDPLKSYAYSKMRIDFNNSLIGNVLKENKFILVEDTKKLTLPRFNSNEKILNDGSLLIMPIYSYSETLGAMIFETSKTGFYSTEDINLLNKICRFTSSYFEIIALKSYIDSNVLVDESTGILKSNVLSQKISQEISLYNDYNLGGIFMLISIDKHDELIHKYGISGYNSIFSSVINIINSLIPVYDFIGKLDVYTIGVYRTGLNSVDGKVFAEKIRKLVAGNIINLDTKSFSVTVSISFVEVQKYNTSDEVIDNCKKILNIAIEEGGNRVKII